LILKIQDLGLLHGKTLHVDTGFRHTTGESFLNEVLGESEKETATGTKTEAKVARVKNVFVPTVVLPIFYGRTRAFSIFFTN
jgi:hypothetical protein